MKVPSRDLAKFLRPFTQIAFCTTLTLATIHSWANSAPIVPLKTQVKQEVLQVSLLDIFLFPAFKFLYAKGNVAPLPSPYAPEFGDPDYLDTYYGKVDPQGKRTTLDDWMAENDFNDYPHLVKKAEYINASDLGFGRHMHCIDNGKTSCYVENYLDPKGESNFAATVTMERMSNFYGTFVAFFVYDSDGNRINQIALDSEGPKSVPESCWACHGGYGHGSAFFGGNYLPFDVNNLEDWPGHPTRASQVANFRSLNYIVWKDAEYLAENNNLTDLIEKWYGGIPFSGTSYGTANTPSTWFTNSNGHLSQNAEVYKKNRVESYLYQEIYGEYCRMCHVAQDLDWQDAHALDFTVAAYNHLCGGADNSPAMPHAEVTYNDFFNNPRHQMPSLQVPTLTANIANLNTDNLIAANLRSAAGGTLVSSTGNTPVASIADDLVLSLKHTGHKMLCEKLPLNIPAGNKTSGGNLFSTKGCSGCHYVGTYQDNKIGGDLECRGAWLRQNMGSLDSAMSGIQLNLQQIQDISRHLNDRPQCN